MILGGSRPARPVSDQQARPTTAAQPADSDKS